MKTKDIFNRVETIVDQKLYSIDKEETSTDAASEEKKDNKNFKEIRYLVIQLVLNVLKAPFSFLGKYIRDEVISSMKKDARLYAIILGIMGVLFVFFSVIWLFISIAIGIYFFEKGESMLISILYSISFQMLSILLISLLGYVFSKQIKSFKLLTKLSESKFETKKQE